MTTAARTAATNHDGDRVFCFAGADSADNRLAYPGVGNGGGEDMNRDEMLELRGRITNLLEELEEIRRHIDADLDSPADQSYDTYDMEADLNRAAENALHDRW